MITIRVFWATGNSAAKGKKVTVVSSKGTKSKYTNSLGSADFELPSGKYKVIVDGKIVHEGPCVGVTTVYI